MEKSNTTTLRLNRYVRGNVHLVMENENFTRAACSYNQSIIAKTRPFLIWGNPLNLKAGTIMGIPLTTQVESSGYTDGESDFNYEDVSGRVCKCLVSQLRAVDVSHIGAYIGTASPEMMAEVERRLRRMLGLESKGAPATVVEPTVEPTAEPAEVVTLKLGELEGLMGGLNRTKAELNGLGDMATQIREEMNRVYADAVARRDEAAEEPQPEAVEALAAGEVEPDPTMASYRKQPKGAIDPVQLHLPKQTRVRCGKIRREWSMPSMQDFIRAYQQLPKEQLRKIYGMTNNQLASTNTYCLNRTEAARAAKEV